MTAKQFFNNPITITVGSILIIAGIAWIGKKYWGWFGVSTNNERVSGCQCTATKGQCGRDQYCDGCNCITESNVNRQEPDLMFNINPKSPIAQNPDGGPRPNPNVSTKEKSCYDTLYGECLDQLPNDNPTLRQKNWCSQKAGKACAGN